MRVYVVTFQLDESTDRLAFSSTEYLIRGLMVYIQKAATRISRKMLIYFEEYQKKEGYCWEWLFTDLHGCNDVREFEKLLKPFNCEILSLPVDIGLN